MAFVRRFSATPGGAPVRLRVRFFLDGNLHDPYSISPVKLFLFPTGGTPIATITPTQESTGIWYVDYLLPTTWQSTVLYDEWEWAGEAGQSLLVQRYKSEIDITPAPEAPSPPFIESPIDVSAFIFSAVQKEPPEAPPKSGFVAKAVPKSIVESVARQSHDRLKTISKSAVEHYLRSFLDTTGRNRETIEAISKGSLQYITDKSIEKTSDPTRRSTQLARLYNELSERTPAIIIVDAGTEWRPGLAGLMSGLTHAMMLEGTDSDGNRRRLWQGGFNKQLGVTLTISVLTNDQDSTDQLMEIVLACLTNLRQMCGGSEIRSPNPQDHWCIRLPLAMAISPNSGANITEDNKDQLWYSNFDLTVDAEDTFYMERPLNLDLRQGFDYDVARNIIVNTNDLSGQLPPEIMAPETIQINTPTTIAVKYLRYRHRVVIDRPMVATIDLDTKTITPRALGTFTLMVLDLGDRDDGQGPRALAPTVAAQKEITVVL
jgi:hypothetical protein